MNTSRLVSLGLGVLGVFVMAGIALGGASAMAVPGPSGPVAGEASASAPTVAASCTISALLISSAPVASINEIVVFSTFVAPHSAGHAACPAISSISYANLPAGPYGNPALSCASANTPVLACGVSNSGLFDVTVFVHLSNGMTATASTWLYVSPPTVTP